MSHRAIGAREWAHKKPKGMAAQREGTACLGGCRSLCTPAMHLVRALHGPSEHAVMKDSVLPTISGTTDTVILSLIGLTFIHNPSPGMMRYNVNCRTPVFLPLSCCSLYLDVGLPPIVDEWWLQGQTQPQGPQGAQTALTGPVGSIGITSS